MSMSGNIIAYGIAQLFPKKIYDIKMLWVKNKRGACTIFNFSRYIRILSSRFSCKMEVYHRMYAMTTYRYSNGSSAGTYPTAAAAGTIRLRCQSR